MSQARDIYEYIERKGSITDAEAAREFNCYRLGARIHDLRKSGKEIVTEMVQTNKRRYARYKKAV